MTVSTDQRIDASGPGTIPSLDGIRTISILVVFAGHAGVSNLIPGGFGVTIFFFLSGYLITTLFQREQAKYGAISIRAFFTRRILRLTPTLWISLAVVYGLIAAGLMPGEVYRDTVLSQMFYFYNYFFIWLDVLPPGPGGLNPLWSLAVEEHFYMIWPFAFVLLVKRDWLLPGLIALLAAFLIWRGVRFWGFGWREFLIYIATETRADSILWGAMLAVLEGRGIARRIFPADGWRRAAVMLGALAVLGLCLVIRDDAFRSVPRYTLQGIALAPLFHYAVRCPDMIVHRPLNWAPVRVLGVYSYAIYLVHYQLIATMVFYGVPLESSGVLFLGAGVMSVAYAAILDRVVERPMQRVRKRITGHRAPASAPPAQAPR